MSGRFFVGVDLTVEMRHGLASHLTAHLEATDHELPGSVIPPSNWHLTLRFVGQLADEGLDRLRFGLDETAWPSPFTARFGSLGAFPNHRRATVLWLGLAEGEAELDDLAGVVEQTVRRAGIVAEERPFVPHLTLSRVRPPADVRELVATVPAFDGSMEIDTVHLFESVGSPHRYPIVDSFPMVGSEQMFD